MEFTIGDVTYLKSESAMWDSLRQYHPCNLQRQGMQAKLSDQLREGSTDYACLPGVGGVQCAFLISLFYDYIPLLLLCTRQITRLAIIKSTI
jgi:hypothetical protein